MGNIKYYEFKISISEEEFSNYIIDVLGFEKNEIEWEDLNESQKKECYEYNR